MKFVPRELVETADVSRGRRSLVKHLRSAIIVIVVLLVAYLLLGLLVDLVVSNISEETEVSWFGWLDFGVSSPTGPTRERFESARGIFERLVKEGDLRPLPYSLHLVDNGHPNAFAVPGGSVGVTRALLENVESERGLAMVLAHELGHQEHRHCLKRLGRSLIFQGAIGLLFGGNSATILERSVELAEAGYSRDQEREADRFGLTLVHRAYGDTEGALEFFEYVYRENAREPGRWAQLLSTHPITRDRLEYLERLGEELERQRPR